VNGILSRSLALLLLQVRVQDGDAGHRLHDRQLQMCSAGTCTGPGQGGIAKA